MTEPDYTAIREARKRRPVQEAPDEPVAESNDEEHGWSSLQETRLYRIQLEENIRSEIQELVRVSVTSTDPEVAAVAGRIAGIKKAIEQIGKERPK